MIEIVNPREVARAERDTEVLGEVLTVCADVRQIDGGPQLASILRQVAGGF